METEKGCIGSFWISRLCKLIWTLQPHRWEIFLFFNPIFVVWECVQDTKVPQGRAGAPANLYKVHLSASKLKEKKSTPLMFPLQTSKFRYSKGLGWLCVWSELINMAVCTCFSFWKLQVEWKSLCEHLMFVLVVLSNELQWSWEKQWYRNSTAIMHTNGTEVPKCLEINWNLAHFILFHSIHISYLMACFYKYESLVNGSFFCAVCLIPW